MSAQLRKLLAEAASCIECYAEGVRMDEVIAPDAKALVKRLRAAAAKDALAMPSPTVAHLSTAPKQGAAPAYLADGEQAFTTERVHSWPAHNQANFTIPLYYAAAPPAAPTCEGAEDARDAGLTRTARPRSSR